MNPAKFPHLRRQPLPTMWDLPSEEVGEPALPDEFHRLQASLAAETCQPPTYPADQIFIGCDLYLYYDSRHTLWYKRPDWFLALGVPRSTHQQEMRLSYVVWQEGIAPFMVMELLSPGTEDEDLGQTLRDASKPPTKWAVYEQILKVPYYVVYDRYVNHLRIFRLEGGRYRELALPNQRLWIEELRLGLGLWRGFYQGITGLWLRWYDVDNQWIPTLAEQAEQAQQQAEQERQRAKQAQQQVEQAQQQVEQAQQQVEQAQQQMEQAQQQAEQERQRAERLAEILRLQGIDPDRL